MQLENALFQALGQWGEIEKVRQTPPAQLFPSASLTESLEKTSTSFILKTNEASERIAHVRGSWKDGLIPHSLFKGHTKILTLIYSGNRTTQAFFLVLSTVRTAALSSAAPLSFPSFPTLAFNTELAAPANWNAF